MNYFINVLITFLGHERGGCIAVNAGSISPNFTPISIFHSNFTKNTVRSICIWTQAQFFIILAVDQNKFMLQLYDEYGLKVQTLSFNLRAFLSQLDERLRNYSSLICTSPLFQGTISNWTVDSKASSWTRGLFLCYFNYLYIIKQVKGLELIISVPFAFGSCCCEPASCSQRISPYK